MSKIHIGASGPAICNADPTNPNSRGCPFRDENGDPVAHYDTWEAAGRAYDEKMKGQLFNSAKKPHDPIDDIDPVEEQINELEYHMASEPKMSDEEWQEIIKRSAPSSVTSAADDANWTEWYHTAPALELPKDFTKIVHAADGSTFLIKKSLFSIYVSDGAGNNAPLKQVKTVADVHNLTEDDVKQAYKAKADYLSNKNQPKKATSKPHSSNYKLVKLEDSKVITPPKASDPHGGYLGGRLFVGGKADTETREVAKSMREDIKKAIAAGELPSDLKYGVRKRPGSYDRFEISIANSRGGRAVAVSENEQKSEGFRNTKEYLENLSRQYFSDDSNAMVDYFNSHNSTSVAFRSDWDDRERERLEQRRSK